MKKIFTLLAASALVFSVKAQNIQVMDPDNGNANISNGTIDFWMAPTDTVIKELIVKNNTPNSAAIKLKRTFVSGVTSTDVCGICWNVCLAPNSNPVQTAGNVTLAAGATANFATSGVGFHGTFTADNTTGLRVVRYTFFNSANPNDSTVVMGNYHVTPTAINEVDLKSFIFSNPMPNPASGITNIKYDFPVMAKAKIKVYNCMGSLVKEMRIEDQTGKLTINTDELSDGIYFYSLVVNDKVVGTKKLIVNN